MWNEIKTLDDLQHFMNEVSYFHDSCIKELKYISGAYVNEDLAMHPVNDRRILKVVIQRQFNYLAAIEMEFTGLKHLNLRPTNDEYTCEIIGATMLLVDGEIYWCDHEDFQENELVNFDGTLICASKLRWRHIENGLGAKEFYCNSL